MELLPVHTPEGYDPLDLLKPLAAALSGEGPAVAPHLQPDRTFQGELPNDEIAAVISTSGSTGTPKQTMLSVDALAASAMGTAFALRAEGQWLLTLPVHYVAGFQVLVRSLYAGTQPWVMDTSSGFTAQAFVDAAAELTDRVRFTSLVPTQLHRLLTDPAPETLRLLRRFDTILLGGAPAGAALRSLARSHDLKVVETYGMSETCGGCVYDGVPLDGVELSSEEGRLWIGGSVLADGYLDSPALTEEKFTFNSGRRWFATEDAGDVALDGTVTVHGRLDDVIITGALKVSAAKVADVIEALPGVEQAMVLGIASEEWGSTVAAAVVGDIDAELVRQAVHVELGAHAVPRSIVTLDAFPLLPGGKPDRRTIKTLLEHA
ncbi:AMP-dependent synthetase [Arthrobacter sp. RIT-PI-e]|uniref:AMP-binding protein n=1 Tax=Arthrobacter sp. RIT-PI-e TaxID=1681197 RepID=UPI0006767D66|nr:AMP-binding protein [Arthrobacter sp. RIT-PI-e]KNC15073.1 AMP-dependent synthetase [Arthrobacter sp. RIT-PI-e]